MGEEELPLCSHSGLDVLLALNILLGPVHHTNIPTSASKHKLQWIIYINTVVFVFVLMYRNKIKILNNKRIKVKNSIFDIRPANLTYLKLSIFIKISP